LKGKPFSSLKGYEADILTAFFEICLCFNSKLRQSTLSLFFNEGGVFYNTIHTWYLFYRSAWIRSALPQNKTKIALKRRKIKFKKKADLGIYYFDP
jgi:hypothetical protein